MRLALPILVVGMFTACGGGPKTDSKPAPEAVTLKPAIASVTPAGTTEGTPFQVQKDGSSAFSLNGQNFDRTSTAWANGQNLKTVFGNPTWITATMPPALFEKAGVIGIKVVNGDGKESEPVNFEVSKRP